MIATNEAVHPSVQRCLITPTQALEWLEQCNSNNRKVSDNHVHCLARDMTEGKWRLTHAGIAFGPDGTLLDGQHRLWAVVVANVSVEMFVWRNIDADAMMTIDCGKSRSMADILNIAGENGDVTADRLALLRAMLAGFGSPPLLSPTETSQALQVHEEAIQFAIDHLPRLQSASGVSNAITRAVIARAYYSVDRGMLKDFCRKLITGIVTSADEGIIVLLRQQLQENRGGSYSQKVQRYGKVQRALWAWLKGESIARLYPATREQFPLPAEVQA
jgi:hypothetical protein